MDNNLIKIDDLVKQRLGGGQELERFGAWSRMEQLLEKEDKRKPFGLYWKRAMSYCGVAMLLAAVSVGSYEMTSAYRTHGEVSKAYPTGTGLAANNSVAVPDKSNTTATNGEVHSSGTGSNSIPTHATAANTTVSNNSVASTDEVSAAIPENKTASTQNKIADNATSGSFATNGVASTSNVPANHAATRKESAIKHPVNVPHAADKLVASGHAKNTNAVKPIASEPTAANTPTATQKKTTTSTTSVNTFAAAATNTAVVNKNDRVIENGHTAAATSQPNNTAGNAHTATNITPMKPGVIATAPVAINTPATHPPIITKPIPGKKIMERIVVQQSLRGTATGTTETHLDTISIDRITMELKKAAENNDKTSAEVASAATATGAKNNTGATPNKKTNIATQPTATNNYGAKTGNANTNTAAKTGVNQVANGGVANKQSTTSASSAEQSIALNAGTGTAAEATGNKGEDNQDIIAPIVPNAAAPATATTPAPAAKQPVAAKKKHGSNMAESLSAMFNEVKYKLGGAQFAPGLTAGINGTFFGPNSFKGFQFGVTGAFELDENWSFMAELKYFHRMNNNYSMYDNYNKYQATAGGFFKDSTERTYSFSTLHSFEMPLSIRYTAARFSFFMGGNFLYTLAVNTGAAERLIDPATRPVVGAATGNSAPSLVDNDFAARFGVGYICGISYKVAPNVMLDFRNAQTVWDNAKADGTKAVSTQLYKSPSLQFSLFYRLGGNNKEPKD